METEHKVAIRLADEHDVDAIARFGAAVIPPHYEPLIGKAAAQEQVDRWWARERLTAALSNGVLLVAVDDANQLVGVAEVGRWEGDPVIWKLYVHPERRGRGIGRALLRAAISEVPRPASRVILEHFAGNKRAATFYEREGFTVRRVEPSPTGVPALGVVWRARRLAR